MSGAEFLRDQITFIPMLGKRFGVFQSEDFEGNLSKIMTSNGQAQAPSLNDERNFAEWIGDVDAGKAAFHKHPQVIVGFLSHFAKEIREQAQPAPALVSAQTQAQDQDNVHNSAAPMPSSSSSANAMEQHWPSVLAYLDSGPVIKALLEELKQNKPSAKKTVYEFLNYLAVILRDSKKTRELIQKHYHLYAVARRLYVELANANNSANNQGVNQDLDLSQIKIPQYYWNYMFRENDLLKTAMSYCKDNQQRLDSAKQYIVLAKALLRNPEYISDKEEDRKEVLIGLYNHYHENLSFQHVAQKNKALMSLLAKDAKKANPDIFRQEAIQSYQAINKHEYAKFLVSADHQTYNIHYVVYNDKEFIPHYKADDIAIITDFIYQDKLHIQVKDKKGKRVNVDKTAKPEKYAAKRDQLYAYMCDKVIEKNNSAFDFALQEITKSDTQMNTKYQSLKERFFGKNNQVAKRNEPLAKLIEQKPKAFESVLKDVNHISKVKQLSDEPDKLEVKINKYNQEKNLAWYERIENWFVDSFNSVTAWFGFSPESNSQQSVIIDSVDELSDSENSISDSESESQFQEELSSDVESESDIENDSGNDNTSMWKTIRPADENTSQPLPSSVFLGAARHKGSTPPLASPVYESNNNISSGPSPFNKSDTINEIIKEISENSSAPSPLTGWNTQEIVGRNKITSQSSPFVTPYDEDDGRTSLSGSDDESSFSNITRKLDLEYDKFSKDSLSFDESSSDYYEEDGNDAGSSSGNGHLQANIVLTANVDNVYSQSQPSPLQEQVIGEQSSASGPSPFKSSGESYPSPFTKVNVNPSNVPSPFNVVAEPQPSPFEHQTTSSESSRPSPFKTSGELFPSPFTKVSVNPSNVPSPFNVVTEPQPSPFEHQTTSSESSGPSPFKASAESFPSPFTKVSVNPSNVPSPFNVVTESQPSPFDHQITNSESSRPSPFKASGESYPSPFTKTEPSNGPSPFSDVDKSPKPSPFKQNSLSQKGPSPFSVRNVNSNNRRNYSTSSPSKFKVKSRSECIKQNHNINKNDKENIMRTDTMGAR